MAREPFTSIEATSTQAEAYLAEGRILDAERCYRAMVAETHHIDYEYDDWLRRLAEIYRQLRRRREAGFIYLYLHYFDLAREAFPEDSDAADRARVLETESRANKEERWTESARLYERARLPVHAAVCFERAKLYQSAAAIWETLAKEPGLRDRRYEQALVHFNLGMALCRVDPDSSVGQRALVESQRRLENVASEFETRGERERAFDCYQILLKLGKESGQFENLAEGYVNCIRVLRDDNLKFYVLQYYEDFIKLALERGELHAASTIYQEAADYSSRTGLPYGGHYQTKAAEAWARCGEKFLADGVPVELVENAFLASVSAFSAVGDYGAVRKLFVRLSELGLSDKKRERYRVIAGRYTDADLGAEDYAEFPEYLKQRHVYADIWFVDLLEWELAGQPDRVAASIVGDLRYPDGIRRRALLVVLTMADAGAKGTLEAPEELARIAGLLGELQSYAALRPLERLYEHEDGMVRQAAIRSLRLLFFKRSFVLIRRALVDAEAAVREAALDALRGLHFPHAFNPLARIFRESEDPLVRIAALESIGRIQSIEAGEFLLMVMRQEQGDLRKTAKQALAAFDNADVLPIVRQYHQIEGNPDVRAELEELLRDARAARAR